MNDLAVIDITGALLADRIERGRKPVFVPLWPGLWAGWIRVNKKDFVDALRVVYSRDTFRAEFGPGAVHVYERYPE